MQPRNRALHGLLIVVTVFLLSRVGFAQPASSVVIEGGTLIDGTGAPPLANAVIVIDGKHIQAVGSAGQVAIPPGAQRVDVRGKFIIPGLFDTHVHLREWMLELFLVYGVTSVIDNTQNVAKQTYWIIAQKEGVEKGKIRGPHIFAGAAFRPGRCQVEDCDEPDSLRQQVDTLVRAGVDRFFVDGDWPAEAMKAIVDAAHEHNRPVSSPSHAPHTAIALGFDGLEHTYTLTLGALSPSEREKFLAAHAKTTPLVRDPDLSNCHCLMPPEASEFMAALLRQRMFLNPGLVKDMKQLHDHQEEFDRQNAALYNSPDLEYVPLVWRDIIYPTLLGSFAERFSSLAGSKLAFGATDPNSPAMEQLRQSYRNTQKFLRQFVAKGGRVMANSDVPRYNMPGLGLHHELILLVDAGLSTMQAIQAATFWPAQFLRKEDEIGTIRPGRVADLLILDANPLENIRNTQRIHMIFQMGVPVDRRLTREYANPIPSPQELSGSSNKPVPRLRRLSPPGVVEQNGTLELKVFGSLFLRDSVLEFDGVRIATRFDSPTELTATVPAYLLARVGTFPVTVRTPGPGGGQSRPVGFIVKFR